MTKPVPEEGLSALDEFAGAVLGDQRLGRRLDRIVGTLEQSPAAGFPQALVTEAELEGFYRFLSNEKVTFDAVLAPHLKATQARINQRDTTLILHDTSEFRFGGRTRREGLGKLQQSGQGFLGHMALAVSSEEDRDVLGVIGAMTVVRKELTATRQRMTKRISYRGTQHLEKELDRWTALVDAVHARVDRPDDVVHIMDSEADAYAIIAKLSANQQRFVIRMCYDRVLDGAEAEGPPTRKARDAVATAETVCTRQVTLSARRRLPGGGRKRTAPREARKATLGLRATSADFRRPSSCPHGPKSIAVNVVNVWEIDPPSDVEPVEWLLVTTEPIDGEAALCQIVDWYRNRWVIEEYFKVIKTGCAYEKRQLDSFDTLVNALAIFIPIAWNLLRMRTLSRATPSAPAEAILPQIHLTVLHRASPYRLPQSPTVRDALLAIAKLGGHLKRNGDPGWQVLGRGYLQLLSLVQGFRLAAQKCDQS